MIIPTHNLVIYVLLIIFNCIRYIVSYVSIYTIWCSLHSRGKVNRNFLTLTLKLCIMGWNENVFCMISGNKCFLICRERLGVCLLF